MYFDLLEKAIRKIGESHVGMSHPGDTIWETELGARDLPLANRCNYQTNKSAIRCQSRPTCKLAFAVSREPKVSISSLRPRLEQSMRRMCCELPEEVIAEGEVRTRTILSAPKFIRFHQEYGEMKISLSRRVMFLIALFLISAPLLLAQESDIKDLAESLAKTLAETGRHPSVAVVDFTDLQANVTPLGEYFAAELEDALVNAPSKVDVIDRSRLQLLIKEHKLVSNGLIDPSTARELGKVAGVGVLITGTITPFGDTVRLSVKALDSDSARVDAAISRNIPKTPTIIELLNQGPSEAAFPKQQTSTPPKPSTSVVVPDTSSTTADRIFESHNVRFEMNSCVRSYTTISCTLSITNLGEDGEIGFQTCNRYPARIRRRCGERVPSNSNNNRKK